MAEALTPMRWPRSSLVAGATFGSIAGAAVISAVWLVDAPGSPRFEPAVQMLGLIAALTGVVAERRAAAQERRHLALTALLEELRKSARLLDDPRFAPHVGVLQRPRVYPRLPVSATDAALVSGALSARRDAELLGRLHTWRDEVNDFNRRLALTEVRLFATGLYEEIGEFERALHRDGGYLAELRRHAGELLTFLAVVAEPVGPRPIRRGGR